MNQKVQEALAILERVFNNTKQILVDCEIPANLIESYMTRVPDFNKMYPDEVVKFYQGIRHEMISYLNRKGFSQREISRRLGGSTHRIVNLELKKEKEKSATTK